MAAIPALTIQAQTASINKMRPSLDYLQTTIFGAHRTHKAEIIEVGYFSRGRKMAPMVRKGAKAIPIEGHTTSFANVEAPNIKISRAFSAETLAFIRQPGMSVFPTDAEMASGLEQSVAIDLQALRDDVGNRNEWLCAQALRGVITYSVADGEVFTITSPRPAANSITLSVFWDDATISLPKPEEDIEAAQGVIHAATGLNANLALCGASAAKYLRRVMKAQDFPLDVKDVFMGGQEKAIWGAARNPSGARPIGRVNGIDFYEYATALTDENGVSQVMIRDKYVELISNTPLAENRIEYGGIPDMGVPGGVFQGEVFSKSWDENDPSVRMVLAHSRPLPVLWRPDTTCSIKVISG